MQVQVGYDIVTMDTQTPRAATREALHKAAKVRGCVRRGRGRYNLLLRDGSGSGSHAGRAKCASAHSGRSDVYMRRTSAAAAADGLVNLNSRP